ncbi:beta-lactamase family protein [Streptomyces sp. NBC_00378]|uniref:serine hydrolase domain-containing protein n=1 Tax=unclassified Streptomyces TaxID=2593676 RepID=UPI00224E5B64|nr:MULTISPECIES: serine hydrolase domain-containing protein [unclassified Streptomyces]MCX5114898.1 beta-lactamase family protein [Streptomyces sp. NBC_00378]
MTSKSKVVSSDRTSTAARPRRRRMPLVTLSCVALSCAALATAVTGTAGSAAAAPAAPAAVSAERAGSPLPGLDPDVLQRAVSSAPDRVTAVLAQVSGPAGRWSGTYGVADTVTGEPVPADGRFRLGSVTKTFIATVVLQLAAEGRVDLDEPVQRYVPGVLPDGYPPIPVRSLLNFTSSLPELTADDLPTTPEGIVEHRFDDHPLAELVAKAVRHDRPFRDPGEKQVYGATGYYVAGMLIEKLTGHSYQQEITNRILRPLHLRHTTAPETDTTIPGPHSHGYIAVPRAGGGTQLVDITEQNSGAGGMISTTGDLDRFLTALFRGRLLPPARMAELFTVPDVPYLGGTSQDPGQGRAYYGAGLMRVTLPDGATVWGKTGSTFGYTDGMFTTRDLRRRLVYSFNPTTGGGNDLALVNRLVSAAFNP